MMDEEIQKAVEELAVLMERTGCVITTAESCTGGMISCALTAFPGASAWFDRSFITYTNKSKHEMLGVSEDTLRRFGAVSEETVSEMLKGALSNSDATLTTAVSGIAGPSGAVPGKPVGTVYVGWMQKGGLPKVKRCQFSGDRQAVRLQTTLEAISGLISLAKGRKE